MKNIVKISRWTIAGMDALGTGMLVVATVLSTPPWLLLYLLAGLFINYIAPPVHKRLSQYFYQKDKKKQTEFELEDPYLANILKNSANLEEMDFSLTGNKNLKRTLTVTALTLLLVGSLAVGGFFLLSKLILPLLPATVLLYSVAIIMFFPLCLLTFFNYNEGIKDVGRDIAEFFQARFGSKQGYTQMEEKDENKAAPQSSFIAKAKPFLLSLGILSCMAGGLLYGAMIHQGVTTTFTSFISGNLPALSVLGGPLAWVMFSFLFISAFSLLGYGLFNIFSDKRDEENTRTWNSFVNPKAYCENLKSDWKKVNGLIQKAQQEYTALKSQDTESAELKALETRLDGYYQQKDRIYHQYSMYQKKGFYPLFVASTVFVFTLCSCGMLMQMARGGQSFRELLTPMLRHSRGVAMGIAGACMWASALAETIFTGTIVTKTMSEELVLGSQSTHYQAKLKEQKGGESTYVNQISRARGAHGIYESLLGLYGSSGESTKTGMAVVDHPDAAPVFAVAQGGRSVAERPDEIVAPEERLVTFRYNSFGQPEKEAPQKISTKSSFRAGFSS
jgi:hypothetical protein